MRMRKLLRMSQVDERDYVLGTHDEELLRLGRQHEAWREIVIDCWRRAGIGPGETVLDVGCGPGYAARDLAAVVGPRGRVVGVDQSKRFVDHAKRVNRETRLPQLTYYEGDVVTEIAPGGAFAFAWCRWVACFVPSPSDLVGKIAEALSPRGIAVFHEYSDYASWRLVPKSEPLEEFVAIAMQSWRAAGGEPDIASELPNLLTDVGFRIHATKPHVFAARPGTPMWEWPASFVETNLGRLLDLDYIDEAFAASVRRELASARDSEDALMFTPTMLEIIAQRA